MNKQKPRCPIIMLILGIACLFLAAGWYFNQDGSIKHVLEFNKYNINIEPHIKKQGENIKCNINSNLEDGSIIRLNLSHENGDMLLEYVTVIDGVADYVFNVPEEWRPGYILCKATFGFNYGEVFQPQNILDKYGSLGENIINEDATINNGYHTLIIQSNIIAYPNDQAIIDELDRMISNLYDDMSFEFTGPNVISNLYMPLSISKVELINRGEDNFIVYLHQNGEENLIVNEIGYFTGCIPIFGEGQITLEVESGEDWSAKFLPVNEALSPVFTGSSYDVSGYFSKPSKDLWRVKHNGDSNFVVYLHTDKGSILVQNEIGYVDSTIMLDIPEGAELCLWEVIADGSWSIKPAN